MRIGHSKPIKIQSPVWAEHPAQRQGDQVLFSGADGRIRKYDGDGVLQWTSATEGETLALTAREELILSENRHGIRALSPKDGQVLWERPGKANLVSDGGSILAMGHRKFDVLSPADGSTLWSADTKLEPLRLKGKLMVTEAGSDSDALVVRSSETGDTLWSTSDGKIDHLLTDGGSVYYASTKLGKHNEKTQRIASRSAEGELLWTQRLEGPLRKPPRFATDGSLVLTQRNPNVPSRSIIKFLNPLDGEVLREISTEHQSEFALSPEGGLLLSEAEHSVVPGEGKARLRALNSKGEELWRRENRPDWFCANPAPVIHENGRVLRLHPQTGETLWSRKLDGAVPIGADESAFTALEAGHRLITLNLQTGEEIRDKSSGHTILMGAGQRTKLVTDHDGKVWEEPVAFSEGNRFVGTWETIDPVQFPLLTGPIEKADMQAVFVDWDGDQQGTPEDPLIVDDQNELVSWSQLKERDPDGDERLESEQMTDLNLWFDNDGDGSVSSPRELTPLLDDSSFDKARLDFSEDTLWLAADSRGQG